MVTNDKEMETGGNKPAVEYVKSGKATGAASKKVEITVNSHRVEMLVGSASGLEIKEAAIRQRVSVRRNFVLQQEMPNGTGKIIGDDDRVVIRQHLSFTAIAPDDNS